LKIQAKTLVIILSSFLVLALLLSYALNDIITKSYLQLERNAVNGDLQRALNLIKIEQDNLRLLTGDWAVWDDSYEFIKSPNKKFIESNLVDSTFVESKLSFIVYVNKAGKIIYGGAYDLSTEEIITLPDSILPHLQPDKILLQPPNLREGVSGLISLSEGVFLISSVPILTSKATGSSPGFLVMGRLLGKNYIEHLSKNLNLDVSVYLYEKLQSELRGITGQLNNTNKFLMINNNENSNSGYSFISNIYNEPSYLLKIDVGRPIYQQGKKTIYLMIVSVFIIIFILVVLVYVLLQVIVLNRLSDLSAQVGEIQYKNNDLNKVYKIKTNEKSNDEIDLLTHSINNMLSSIYESNLGLEKAKKAAESASKAKSEFLSTMNHELRTPLHVVVGYTDLLSKTNLDEKQKTYIKSVLSGSSSLLNLIDDVLDFSKIESGKFNVDKEKMSLPLLIDEVANMFGQSISDNGVRFEVSFLGSIPDTIITDEYRLKQILLNLLSNAKKFTEQGEIKLHVEALSSTKSSCVNLCFMVKDTGIGIPEESQKNIFNKFVQQDGQDTRKYGGTGLGLAISQKLAALLNGDVNVNSIVGEGSTFTLILYDVEISAEL